MLNLHRKYQFCLTVAAGYRAESVYCTTYTIRGLQSSEAGTSYLLNLKIIFQIQLLSRKLQSEMKRQLCPPPNLCYDGQLKNISLLVVDRDNNIQFLQTNAKEDHNATNDNRKSCGINQEETDNINFNLSSERLSCIWSI